LPFYKIILSISVLA